MDLLVGARKVIVTTTHTSKDGKSKILKECNYPITSTRSVDVIITELAVFCEIHRSQLHLVELMPNVTLEKVSKIQKLHLLIAIRRNHQNEGSSNCRRRSYCNW